jgi:hypothetical protein
MEGYGTVFIECHDGVFRVLVWGKNQEDPSHIIELPRITQSIQIDPKNKQETKS